MEMNQTCKVCGEPAAGFHFGAFTCEGCKSFFGRSYNNLSSITECKNNGQCVINKKNRTTCKACRLRKCMIVGMSKSGSRYGRRSNWFKIHCLLQEQNQTAVAVAQAKRTSPPTHMYTLSHPAAYQSGLSRRPTCTKEELLLLGFEDYKNPSASPSVSSPDSHNSDSSVEVGDRRNNLIRQNINRETMGFSKDMFLPLAFGGLSSMNMPPPSFLPATHLLFPGYHPSLYAQHHGLLKPFMEPSLISSPLIANNNNRFVPNHNNKSEKEKRFFLDEVLKSQQESLMNVKIKTEDEEETEELVVSATPPRSPATTSPSPKSPSTVQFQDSPIDLSMKTNSSTSDEVRTLSGGETDTSDDELDKRISCDSDFDGENFGARNNRRSVHDTTPLDLTTNM